MTKSEKKKIAKWIVSLVILAVISIIGYYESTYIEKTAEVEAKAILEDECNFENDKLNIMFFYVGQADSTFIELNDITMLIDAGNNQDGKEIVSFLKERNIENINYLVGTHSDEDHIGGLDDIIKEFNIEKLYIPKIGQDGRDYKNVIKEANNKHIDIINPVRGDEFYLDCARCEIMSAMENENVSDNNSSIVIQMEYEKTKYLFMGDAEKEVENSRNWDKVDVLKVGHHGSNSSSSEKFLFQVKPKFSIIEVGKNNSYNLPNNKAISRLEKSGTNIFRTDSANKDEEGSFWLISDGENINIKTVNINLDGNS